MAILINLSNKKRGIRFGDLARGEVFVSDVFLATMMKTEPARDRDTNHGNTINCVALNGFGAGEFSHMDDNELVGLVTSAELTGEF